MVCVRCACVDLRCNHRPTARRGPARHGRYLVGHGTRAFRRHATPPPPEACSVARALGPSRNILELIERKAPEPKAVAIYAEAYNQSLEAREFYEFLKTMETYESTLSDQDTLILSTDSDFFRFLKESTPATD